MAVYSISELEGLTGVKAHTIRIWEKRYSLVKPSRTETNIRYYNDEDLKTLINAALLNKNGFRISQIANMEKATLLHHVTSITSVEMSGEEQADVLSLSLIDLNANFFNKVIQKNIKTLGFERTMLEIIYPFIEKLGLLWLSGAMNQVHEKFLNTVLNQIISAQINLLKQVRNGPKIIAFLPEGNQQKLSLLFSHYLLKKYGLEVINLGDDCSLDDIIVASKISKAPYVFTINIEEQDSNFQLFAEKLSETIDGTLIISGNAVDITTMI